MCDSSISSHMAAPDLSRRLGSGLGGFMFFKARAHPKALTSKQKPDPDTEPAVTCPGPQAPRDLPDRVLNLF